MNIFRLGFEGWMEMSHNVYVYVCVYVRVYIRTYKRENELEKKNDKQRRRRLLSFDYSKPQNFCCLFRFHGKLSFSNLIMLICFHSLLVYLSYMMLGKINFIIIVLLVVYLFVCQNSSYTHTETRKNVNKSEFFVSKNDHKIFYIYK